MGISSYPNFISKTDILWLFLVVKIRTPSKEQQQIDKNRIHSRRRTAERRQGVLPITLNHQANTVTKTENDENLGIK